MSIIRVLRHGETTYNANGLLTGRGSDPALTEQGKLQAEKVGQHLYDNHYDDIELIVSSNMTRTNETAGIINNFLNKTMLFDPEIQEKDQGGYEGHSKDYALPIVNGLPDDVSHPIHGGETRSEFDKRITTAICKYHAMPEHTILLVSHGFVIERLSLFFKEIEAQAHNAHILTLDPEEINMAGKCGINPQGSPLEDL